MSTETTNTVTEGSTVLSENGEHGYVSYLTSREVQINWSGSYNLCYTSEARKTVLASLTVIPSCTAKELQERLISH